MSITHASAATIAAAADDLAVGTATPEGIAAGFLAGHSTPTGHTFLVPFESSVAGAVYFWTGASSPYQ
jgi:hypothetical protein